MYGAGMVSWCHGWSVEHPMDWLIENSLWLITLHACAGDRLAESSAEHQSIQATSPLPTVNTAPHDPLSHAVHARASLPPSTDELHREPQVCTTVRVSVRRANRRPICSFHCLLLCHLAHRPDHAIGAMRGSLERCVSPLGADPRQKRVLFGWSCLPFNWPSAHVNEMAIASALTHPSLDLTSEAVHAIVHPSDEAVRATSGRHSVATLLFTAAIANTLSSLPPRLPLHRTHARVSLVSVALRPSLHL